MMPEQQCYTFAIPNYLPPSLNRLLRMHWAKRARLKRECLDFVAVYSRLARVPDAVSKRRVSLSFRGREGERAADPDARLKFLLDALVGTGLLVDDSPQWCELGGVTTLASVAGGRRQTVISLEDLLPPPPTPT